MSELLYSLRILALTLADCFLKLIGKGDRG